MRMIVFFDLPMDSLEEKKEYRMFRKLLISNGFMMMQKSVYCRMVLNQSQEASVSEIVRTNKPSKGLVQLLTITEKQFSKIEYISGEKSADVIDTDERVVVL